MILHHLNEHKMIFDIKKNTTYNIMRNILAEYRECLSRQLKGSSSTTEKDLKFSYLQWNEYIQLTERITAGYIVPCRQSAPPTSDVRTGAAVADASCVGLGIAGHRMTDIPAWKTTVQRNSTTKAPRVVDADAASVAIGRRALDVPDYGQRNDEMLTVAIARMYA